MSSGNKLWRFSAVCFVLASCGSNAVTNQQPEVSEKKQQVTFIYEDVFSPEEKQKLEEWIGSTSSAAQKVLGEFPFDLYYHFHREDHAGSAVIFGHTDRKDSINAAHFYVNPAYSTEDLKKDWIAPHEISHLALPKLGKSNRWFFEGFATYMSRQVMIETGIFTGHEVDSINTARIAAVKNTFEHTSSLLPFVADSLMSGHQYSAVYWIGASFFDQADQKLNASGKGPLTDVLKEFQVCCHVPVMTIDEVIAAFDKISESQIFSDLYVYYTTAPCNQLLVEYQVYLEHG